jgi:hypothetical protein
MPPNGRRTTADTHHCRSFALANLAGHGMCREATAEIGRCGQKIDPVRVRTPSGALSTQVTDAAWERRKIKCPTYAPYCRRPSQHAFHCGRRRGGNGIAAQVSLAKSGSRNWPACVSAVFGGRTGQKPPGAADERDALAGRAGSGMAGTAPGSGRRVEPVVVIPSPGRWLSHRAGAASLANSAGGFARSCGPGSA